MLFPLPVAFALSRPLTMQAVQGMKKIASMLAVKAGDTMKAAVHASCFL
jgi:hypothetical protein